MEHTPWPSLNALRAFVVASRHGSFKGAAGELCVTPSAVSQLVKTLEAHLGLELFARTPRGLELTEAGARLQPELEAAFVRIGEALASVRRAPSRHTAAAPSHMAGELPAVCTWRMASSCG